MSNKKATIGNITLQVPLSTQQSLYIIGALASKLPYENGEGLAAQAVCREIASKMKSGKVTINIKAVDVLVKMVDNERDKGNDNAVHDIKNLIKLLKGGIDRKVIGAMLYAINHNLFKETEDGKLKTELVIEKPINHRAM